LGALTFDRPDRHKFPCLGLAYEAINTGGSLPAVLNAANEVCVEAFLAGRLAFMRIPAVVEKVMREHKPEPALTVRKIMAVDFWARERAREIIDK
jgi:1-deoxy-D-xylulose-5-phosphate reductoisomerase